MTQANPKEFPKAGSLSSGVTAYLRATPIAGYMNIDDAQHFSLVLGLQNACGPHGDILEIGTFFGRSASIIATLMRPGERLVVCDAYNTNTTIDKYPNYPSVEQFRENVRLVAPDFDQASLVIHNCLSKDLKLPPDDRFRCAHIDAGHSHEEALFDLRLVADHIVKGGLIIVDDYLHPSWPGVTTAVEAFLKERNDFVVVAAMNRSAAAGQKLYLSRGELSGP